jgi:hypothetical protein
MDAAQLGTLIVFLGSIGFVLYLVLAVEPRMAHSRLLIELSKVRSVLRDMGDEEPVIREHPDVERLDDLLARTIRHGHSPGMSALLGAAAAVWRDRHAGRSTAPAPTFRGLSASQRVALYLLMHRTSLEVVRASIFGSRLWFVAWPAWLLVFTAVRQAETLQRGSGDDTSLARVVSMGTDLDSRQLQLA